MHVNDLVAIVKRAWTENMELPNKFTGTALKSPSGTVYEKTV